MSATRTTAPAPSGSVLDPTPEPTPRSRGSRTRRSAGQGTRRSRVRRVRTPKTKAEPLEAPELGHRVPRHRLLLACVAAVSLGMLAVLFINAVLSQGAFRQHDLEIKLVLLSEHEEALARAVQVDEAPLTVEARARSLGMVPGESPVFLSLKDAKVLGEPVPAPTPTGPVEIGPTELTAPAERLSGSLYVPPPEPSPSVTPSPGASQATTVDPSAPSASPSPSAVPSQTSATGGAR